MEPTKKVISIGKIGRFFGCVLIFIMFFALGWYAYNKINYNTGIGNTGPPASNRIENGGIKFPDLGTVSLINEQINYQGKLTDSSRIAVADGTYNMEFALYTAPTGGTAIWTETRTGANKVQVTSGLFSVLLGEVTAVNGVDFNQTLYVGVKIGGSGAPVWDAEMTPRKKLGAVATAILADTALNVTNGVYTNFANSMTLINPLTTIPESWIGPSATSGIYFKGGNVGMGTTSPGQKLSVAGDILGNNIIGSTFIGTSTTASSTLANGLNITKGCFSVLGVCLPSNATSTNYWYANGNDIYKANSGNVGVGTTTPSAKLSVTGTGTGTGRAFAIANSSSIDSFTVADNGNVFSNGNILSAGSMTATGAVDTTGATGLSLGLITSAGIPNTNSAVIGWTSGFSGLTNGSLILSSRANNTGADTHFYTGGLPAMRISGSTQNVGIGATTTPYAKLSVSANSSGTVIAVDTVSAFTGFLIDLKVASSTKFSVDQSGNIVSSGSFAFSSLPTNSLLSTNASGVITATSTPTIGSLIATSTTATSTFAGGVNIGTTASQEGRLVVRGLGTGTSTSASLIVEDSAGTNTFSVLDSGQVGVGKNVTLTSPGSFSLLNIGQNLGSGLTITNSVAINPSVVSAINGSMTLVGTASFGATRGLDMTLLNNNTSTGNVVRSIYASPRNNTAGSRAASLIGGTFDTVSDSTGGTITSMTGVETSNLVTSAGGTITNGYGFRVNDMVNLGTFTNTYGVYVGDITTGTQTNTPYSFYASDANTYNYFSGNVGIGSTTPGSLLSLGTTNGINFSTATSTFNSTGGINLAAGCFAVSGTCISASGSNLWQTNGTNISNTNAGNVGIGTTSPSDALTVNGMIGVGPVTASNITRGGVIRNNVDDGQFIAFSSFTPFKGAYLILNSTGVGGTSASDAIINFGDFTAPAAPAADFRIRYANNGVTTTIVTVTDLLNFGISTTTPYAKLSVVGTSAASTTLALRPAAGQTANTLDIYNTSGALTTVVDSAGNIGIGTTTPGQKLSVGGDILGNNFIGSYFTATSTSNTSNFASFVNTSGTTGGYKIDDILVFQASSTLRSIAIGEGASSNGGDNIAIGKTALAENTSGTTNLAIGNQALTHNTTGGGNIALGQQALIHNISSSNSLAIGTAALFANTDGYQNVALGGSALTSITTGERSTAVGYLAGSYISTGADNTTSNNSIYLGYNTRALADGDTNEIVIGNSATGVGSNSVVLGNDSILKTILKGNVGIGTTTPGQKLSVGGDILGNNIIGSTFIGTSTTASSTLANGLNITKGCFSVLGVCLPSNATSTNYWQGNGTAIYNTNSGSVGVGTSTPAYPLDVNGNIRAGVAGINNNTFVTDTANGRVGIGTASPSKTLETSGDILVGNGGSGTAAYVYVGGSRARFGWDTGQVILDDAGANKAIWIGNNSLPRIWIRSGTPTQVGIGNTTPSYALDVTGQGHYTGLVDAANFVATSTTAASTFAASVGIGTTTPTSQLHVANNSSGATSVITVDGSGSGGDGGSGINFQYGSTAATTWNIGMRNQAPAFALAFGYGSGGVSYNAAFAKMVLTTGGNLGIGSTTPGSILSVGTTNGINFSTATSTFNSTGGINLIAGCFAMSGTCISATGSNLWQTSGANISNTNAGNVGIGTTTPPTKLTIDNSNASAGVVNLLTLSNTSGAGSNNGSAILFSGYQSRPQSLISSYMNPGISVGGTLQLQTYQNNATPTLNVGIVLDNAGNVGIGTTSPNTPLEIYNTAGSTLRLSRNDTNVTANEVYGAVEFYGNDISSSATGYLGVRAKILGFNDDTACSTPGFGSCSSLSFYTAFDDSANLSEKMRLTATGNVGIGTTSPVSKLAVSGGFITVDGTISTGGFKMINNLGTAATILSANNTTANTIAVGDIQNQFDSTDIYGGGSIKMRLVSSTGNFGIGSTTPGSLLSIGTTNGINFSTATSTFNSTGGINLIAGCYAVSGTCISASGSNLWQTSGTNISNTNAGNVGIGISAPTTKLHVVGDEKLTGDLVVGSNASSTMIRGTGSGGAIQILADTGTVNRYLRLGGVDNLNNFYPSISIDNPAALNGGVAVGIGTTSPLARLDVAGVNSGSAPLFQLSSVAAFATTTRLVVTNGGSVGIGTIAPVALLQVKGGTNQEVQIGRTLGAFTSVTYFDDLATFDEGINMSRAGDGLFTQSIFSYTGFNGDNQLGIASRSDIRFMAGSTGSNITFLEGGFVGIGTSTPLSKLTVWGTAAGTTLTTYQSDPNVSITNANGGANTFSSLDFRGKNSSGTQITTSAIIGQHTDLTAASEDGDIVFMNRVAGTISEKMRLQGSNLGIASTTPKARLSVTGSTVGTTNRTIDFTDSANTSLFDVLDNGNIGIGTNAPLARLEIVPAGSNPFTTGLVALNHGAILIDDTSNGPESIGGIEFQNNSGGSGYGYKIFTNNSTDAMGIATRFGSGSWTTAFTLKQATGNIGIGSTTPFTKLDIGSSDIGNGSAGPAITIGRNTNATNPGAGSINYLSKSGVAGYVWQDAAGNLRINTSAPTTANDAAGTVIGSQTSERSTKQDIGDFTDYSTALSMINDVPLHTFRYIKEVNGYGPDSPLAKFRIGYIADEVDPTFMEGNAIDQVSVNGLLMASVKQLNFEVTTLQLNSIGIDTSSFASTTGQRVGSFFNYVLKKVENGVAYMRDLVIDTLTIGSPEKPTGVTIYDKNGQPGCLEVNNVNTGQVSVRPGVCGNQNPSSQVPAPAPISTTTDTTSGQTPFNPNPNPNPTPTPTPEPISTSTPPTSTSTPPTSTSTPPTGSLDTTAPVITLNGPAAIDLKVGDTYVELGAVATDNIDATSTVVISGSTNTTIVGTSTIFYNATDLAGNHAIELSRIVNVSQPIILPPPDTTPPVITLTGASTINLNVGDAYAEEGATATDDIDASVSVVTGGSVDTATAGTYTISYNAKDAAGNNATEVTRTIIVAAAPEPAPEPVPIPGLPTTGTTPQAGSDTIYVIIIYLILLIFAVYVATSRSKID